MIQVIPFIYEDRDDLYANTYVLIDENKACVVIDPAKSYDGLANYIKKNELYLKNVIGDFNDIKNIDVVTSGLSLNEEKGLLVGKIKKVKKEEYGLSNEIIITPSVDFNNINYVSIEVYDE